MAKYLVDIVRTGYSCRVIEVEAPCREAAIEKALDAAPSFYFSETESEYDWQSVKLVEEKDGENGCGESISEPS